MMLYQVVPWTFVLQVIIGGSVSIPLPDAVASDGHVMVIKVVPGGAAAYLVPSGNQMIDGSAKALVVPPGEGVIIQANSSQWYALSKYSLSAGGYSLIREDGSDLPQQTTLNFTGVGISCFDSGTFTECTVGSYYQTIQDEGSSLPLQNVLDFIGAGVTCSDTGIKTRCEILGGGGGGNSVEQSVVITSVGYTFSQVITGQAWVATTSEIVCSVLGTTADGLTPESIAVAGLHVTVSDRIAGTGFTIWVHNQYGLEGTVRVHCLGV